MSALTVTDWYQIIADGGDDLKLAKELLSVLLGYHVRDGSKREDLQQLINLFSAIRLDQMAKEGSA